MLLQERNAKRESGGTVRRARLRGVWLHRTGSSPVSRTIEVLTQWVSTFTKNYYLVVDSMKKLTLVAVTLLLIGCVLVSCGEVAPRNFVQGGMSITLDSSFIRNTNVKGYSTEFRSSKATVYVLREWFGLSTEDESFTLTSDMTLEQYADYVLKANDMENTELTKRDRYVFFVYEDVRNEVEYTNHVCLYKTVDAFWMISFVCPSDSYEELKLEIAEWASSVEFSKETDATTVVTTEKS